MLDGGGGGEERREERRVPLTRRSQNANANELIMRAR